MLGNIWDFVLSNLSLEKVSVGLVAVTVAVDRVAAVVGKVQSVLAMLRAARETKAAEAIEDAVVMTSRVAGTALDKVQDLTKERADELLTKATDAAVLIGRERGVDVTKVTGGEAGLAAATQGAFKRIKAALTPGK